ncbi:MAG: hypothetical protein AB2L07_12495 [Thermoanaerobaculaceae bacterium]
MTELLQLARGLAGEPLDELPRRRPPTQHGESGHRTPAQRQRHAREPPQKTRRPHPLGELLARPFGIEPRHGLAHRTGLAERHAPAGHGLELLDERLVRPPLLLRHECVQGLAPHLLGGGPQRPDEGPVPLWPKYGAWASTASAATWTAAVLAASRSSAHGLRRCLVDLLQHAQQLEVGGLPIGHQPLRDPLGARAGLLLEHERIPS